MLAAEREAAHARQLARAAAVEHGDDAVGLAAGGRVEPHEPRRLLDEAVGLAGDDVGVVGQADVQALPAAADGQQQLLRALRDGHGGGERALEAGDRAPEGVGGRRPAADPVRHEHREHLRVGRDAGRHAQAVPVDQLAVVVDVAVDAADHVRARDQLVLLRVERVGVRLADGADAGPAGVADHDRVGVLGGERGAEQLVAADGVPQRAAVLAQLADLRRDLVDEAQVALGRGRDRAVAEAGVVGAGLELRGDARRLEVEVVARHEHVQAGRVAAADLQAVQRRQRDLDREVALERRRGGVRAREVVDRRGGGQAVADDGPACVLGGEQAGVEALDEGRVHVERGRVERRLRLLERRPDRRHRVAELRGQPGGAAQAVEARGAAQLVVERAELLGARADAVGVGEDGLRRAEQRDGALGERTHGVGRRGPTGRPPPCHGDDSAHGPAG